MRRDGKPRTQAEKVAVGTMLRMSDQTEKRLQAPARAASAEVAKKREDRAVLLGALVLLGRRLGDQLTDAIARGRAEARNAARRRLREELSGVGVVYTMSTPAIAQAGAKAADVDVQEARIAADSLVAQWRALELAAAREGESERFYRSMGARIARTAQTETARAYNEEHRTVVREMSRVDPELGQRVQREWSAMIDACSHCWGHDGERVGLDENFDGGDEPGSMHPRCQCLEYLVASA
jgi:hypothetical protein